MFHWRLWLHASRTFWCLLPFIAPSAVQAETHAQCEQRFAQALVELVVSGLDRQPTTLIGEVSGERILAADVKDGGVVSRFVGTRL